MAERGLSDPIDAGIADVESFLVEHVRANPGLRFGVLVQAARNACHVSPATIARHLARLVRLGDLTLLSDRTYVVGDPSIPSTRAVMEVRWYDVAHIIRPDGTARVFMQEEFRVVSGQLDHIEFNFPKALPQFIWWCTTAGRMYRIPGKYAPGRYAKYHLEFSAPLAARHAAWERFCLNAIFPRWYRMGYVSTIPSRHAGPRDARRHESEWMEIRSQTPRFGCRLASDAHLRLQVVHPEGYPVGRVRCRVRYQSERERVDAVEEMRLRELSSDELHQDGLRRFGTTLTLSVPRPRLDRIYEIEWTLPTDAQRKRWMMTRHRSKSP